MHSDVQLSSNKVQEDIQAKKDRRLEEAERKLAEAEKKLKEAKIREEAEKKAQMEKERIREVCSICACRPILHVCQCHQRARE